MTRRSITLQLKGALGERLLLNGNSQGYLNAELSGWLQPLDANLPAELQAKVASFKASAELPDSLILEQVVITARGDLAAGYRLDGEASLPAADAPMALTLSALLNAEGAQIKHLNLDADAKQQVHLSDEVNWLQGLSLDTRFTWQQFLWQRLYPLAEAPPVALRSLNGELAYQDGHYLGHCAGMCACN